MPPRKAAKGKYVKKQKRKAFTKKRSYRSNKEVMVNRMPKSSHSVIAPHYYTSIEASFYGVVGATAGTSAGQFHVATNSANLPFAEIQGASLRFDQMTGATLSPGTNPLTALQPAGYSLLAKLYKSYRVYKYWLSVTATPASANDTVGLSIVPYGIQDALTLPGLSQQELMSLPYSKAIMCTQANTVTKNKIISSMMPRTILGQSKLQYKDEIDTAGLIATAPAISTFAACTYNTIDGADLGDKLYFEVKIRFWLEFFDPVEDLGVI